MKFPKTLQRRRYLKEETGTGPTEKGFNWMDISNADQLCEFYSPNIRDREARNKSKSKESLSKARDIVNHMDESMH